VVAVVAPVLVWWGCPSPQLRGTWPTHVLWINAAAKQGGDSQVK
jgi:hypothetical protein